MAHRQQRRWRRTGRLVAALSLGLPVAVTGSFVALPLHIFAEGDETRGVRHFSHSEQHMLEDGSDLSLQWRALADPDSILALDAEGSSGVQLLECRPQSLLLRVPASHEPRVQSWRHVVASRLLHGCAHLEEHPMYHRVLKVERTVDAKHGAAMFLHTQEVYSVAEVLPHIDFSYVIRPIDSMREAEQKAQRELMAQRGNSNGIVDVAAITARRLLPLQKAESFPKFWKKQAHFKAPKMKSNFLPVKGGPNGIHDLLNFTPLKNAKFGWNWDFDLNSTRSPNFRYNFPGGKGSIAFRDPFLKVDAGLKIAFQSNLDMDTLSVPPHVVVTADLYGNAKVNLDFYTTANVKEDVNMADAIDSTVKTAEKEVEQMSKKLSRLPGSKIQRVKRFHVPLLKNFTQETYYFKPIEFYLASIPVRIAPGVSIGLDAFHLGRLKGSLRAGANTKIHINGTVVFDSNLGVTANFSCEAVKLRINTPTWLVFTRHFEMGAALKPSLWLRGSFGHTKNMEVQAELIPYFNVSVLQQGNQAVGPSHLIEKQLVIYPFRAIGLQPGTEWALRIIAHGQSKTSSRQVSTGVIEFNDPIQTFHFGRITQRDVLEEPISVQLLKDGVTPVGALGKLFCESVLAGECHPAPSEASFLIDGSPVVLQFTMAWQDEPTQFLLGKVRSFGLIAPQLLNLTSNFGRETLRDKPKKAIFRFQRNLRTYDAEMQLGQTNDGQLGPAEVRLKSSTAFEMGPEFVHSWHIGYGSYSKQEAVAEAARPIAQLIYEFDNGKTKVVGQAQLPGIPWDKDIRGTYGQPFLGVLQQKINLMNPSTGNVVATGDAGIEIEAPQKASYWLCPAKALDWPLGSKQPLHWTIDAAPKTPIEFIFSALKVSSDGEFAPTPMVHKLPKKVCQQNAALAHHFGGYGTPCVFTEMLDVDGLVGTRIVFRIEWTLGGLQRSAISAPVTFVDAHHTRPSPPPVPVPRPAPRVSTAHAPTRGTSASGWSAEQRPGQDVELPMKSIPVAVPVAPRQRKSLQRRLQVAADRANIFNQKMMESQHRCDRQPLEYSVGVGLFFRARVHNLHLPGFAQALALPNWDSGLMELTDKVFGKKLSQVLPKAMCGAGVCDGTLPSCPVKKVAPTIIPRVEFQLSRAFLWSQQTTIFTKEAISYGMALAPGMLELAAVSVKKLLKSTTTTTFTRTDDDMFFKDKKGEVCVWMPVDGCVNAFTFEGISHFGCTRTGSDSGWCSQDELYAGRWKSCRKRCRKSWSSLVPNPSQEAHKEEEEKLLSAARASRHCWWERAQVCVTEFTYRGSSYYGCLPGPDKTKAWCPDASLAQDRWHHCHWKCSDEMSKVPSIDVPDDMDSTSRHRSSEGSQDRNDGDHDELDSAETSSRQQGGEDAYAMTERLDEPSKAPDASTTMESVVGEAFNALGSTPAPPPPIATEVGTSTTSRRATALDSTTGDAYGQGFAAPPLETSQTSGQAQLAQPSEQKTTTASPVVDKSSWQCHHYDLSKRTDREWDKWCKTNPTKGDTEYRWFADSLTPPASCAGCWCCKRRRGVRLLAAQSLEVQHDADNAEKAQESDTFTVDIRPDALIYKVDEELVHALIDKGAFHGLHDGREESLGEARIIGFKIHHDRSSSENSDAEALQPARGAALLQRLPEGFWIVGTASLLLALVVARFARRRGVGHVEYEKLRTETASLAA